MKPRKPVHRWPWCDVCQMHVREIDGVKHVCQPEQLDLFGVGR